MSLVRSFGRVAALALLPACAGAQYANGTDAGAAAVASANGGELPLKHAAKPTTAAITEQDLMSRLYVFADDSMQGRATGTEGYRKGTDYIAAELRRLGLQPAGENGTYFQSMPSRAFGAGTRLSAGGAPLAIWQDFVPVLGAGAPRAIEGAGVVFGGPLTAYVANAQGAPPLSAAQIAGRVVVVSVPQGAGVNSATMSALVRGPLGAAAAVAVVVEQLNPQMVAQMRRPGFGAGSSSEVPYGMLVTSAAATRLLGAAPSALQAGATGPAVSGALVVERIANDMARNVVAVLPGTDARLRGQYVALGAHADHVGFNTRPVDHDSLRAFNAEAWRVRGSNNDAPNLTVDQRARIRVNMDSLRALRPARLDSISNGADDDGSGSMALLEIAESFALGTEKPGRSLLFVWHAAEEMGLLGARHFADNPTVPRDSIVAQLNIDMIGRGTASDLVNGGPGYVGMIGSRRLSSELGELAVRVNEERRAGMRFDYGMDADGHPQNIYCRSDHYHYARYGIPIAFFFTGLHGDYHQVTDEPQYIDYANYTRITSYIRDLALAASTRPAGFTLDKPKPDPNGACRQ